MHKLKDDTVWEGVSFRSLALAMSWHKEETFGAYMDRLARNGEWLDAGALHALACSFNSDLIVWQVGIDPALMGHSCVAVASPSSTLLHVALVNDRQYWGVQHQADQQRFDIYQTEVSS